MPQLALRMRRLRPCDQLLVIILCANCFYLMHHMTSSGTIQIVSMPGPSEETWSEEITKEMATGTEMRTTSTPVTSRKMCPLDPPVLLGSLVCDCGATTPEFLINSYQHLEQGGRTRPSDCQPRQRTAIIIPYRDRFDQLHSLLRMLIPILSRQQVDATFFVIEQTNSSLFNRAALHNIGFLEAQKQATFDCLIFHDVDLVPVDDRNLYRCSQLGPRHLAATIKLGPWVPPKVMLRNDVGGVMCFTPQQYEIINGNSNLYFGFGGENGELYHRIVHKNLTLEPADPAIAAYHSLFHEKQEITIYYHERLQILKSSERRQDVEGLNTCKYRVDEVRLDRLYTWITVSLDLEEVLKTAPIYTILDIKEALVNNSTA